MNQAPKGGMTSQVNGQWYEGGEFMPEHGLFCGKKGEVRRKKVEKAKVTGKLIDLGGSKLFEVFQQEQGKSWVSYIVATVIADSHKQAEIAVNKERVWSKEI